MAKAEEFVVAIAAMEAMRQVEIIATRSKNGTEYDDVVIENALDGGRGATARSLAVLLGYRRLSSYHYRTLRGLVEEGTLEVKKAFGRNFYFLSPSARDALRGQSKFTVSERGIEMINSPML